MVRVSGDLAPDRRSCTGSNAVYLLHGPGHLAGLTGPPGKVVPGSQGVRVLGAGYPLPHRQQRRELVAGPATSPAFPVQ